MYNCFLDDVQFPVPPPSMSVRIANRNETVTLINDGEINLLKAPGLTEVSFELLLPNSSYPFAVYEDGFKPAAFYLDKLEKLKVTEEPFRFIFTRSKPDGTLLFDTNMTVTLEEYEINEDAEEGFDVKVPISLKQYKPYGTKKKIMKVTSNSGKDRTQKVKTTKTRPTKKPAKSYTVKAGDTLWEICQKQIGDGDKFKEIAKLNNIKNPNLIRPGQVIRFE